MAIIGQGVPSYGIHSVELTYTFNAATGVAAANEGSAAMSLDTTANMTAKLAGDGEPIIGQLYKFEDRTVEGVKVCTVRTNGFFLFKVKTGETVNRGDYVVGAGSGEVKALAASTDTDGTGSPTLKHASHDKTNMVVEVNPNGRTGYVSVWVK